MGFVERYPINKLRPAPYNPRVISEDAIDTLRASIRLTGGLAKPIIATNDGLLIAGHQRTKASQFEGMSTVPAYIIDRKFNQADEVRFNQLHNGADIDAHRHLVTIPKGTLGYGDVSPKDITIPTEKIPGATIRKEICELMLRYGAWGGIVATESGRVLSAPQYAISCVMLSMPCRVYRVRDAIADDVCRFFDRQYGQFDYSHLERETWRQTFAQPYRFREGSDRNDTHREQRSALYDDQVLRRVTPIDRLLDFGCGQADYVKMLRKRGYNIHGIEFFYRNNTRGIDTRATHEMIDATLTNLAEHGQFDAVMADYVLNSVDTPQAESDVLTCLNAFVKMGGIVFLSARKPMENPNATRAMGMVRLVEFVDKDGFTAIHSRGGWFFQRRHSRDEMQSIATNYFGDNAGKVTTHNSTGWCLVCRKRRDLSDADIEAALRREFDLPWPTGRVGRADAAVNAWRLAKAKGVAK